MSETITRFLSDLQHLKVLSLEDYQLFYGSVIYYDWLYVAQNVPLIAFFICLVLMFVVKKKSIWENIFTIGAMIFFLLTVLLGSVCYLTEDRREVRDEVKIVLEKTKGEIKGYSDSCREFMRLLNEERRNFDVLMKVKGSSSLPFNEYLVIQNCASNIKSVLLIEQCIRDSFGMDEGK